MLKNKKADENTAIFSPAKQKHISFAQILNSLSDFFVSLYRYFRLKKLYKGSVNILIDTLYKEQISYIDNRLLIN